MLEITSPREFTKSQLMMAALRLFAEKGIASVRVREIVAEAKAKNNGAVFYHFGSKDNLVVELFSLVQHQFDAIRKPMIKDANKRAKESRLPVEDVIEILIQPYVTLIENEEWGVDAVRFIARSLMEFTPEMKKTVESPARISARSLTRLLPSCVPHVPRKLLLTRFNFVVDGVIHGFAEHRSLKNSYFGDLSYPNLRDLADIYTAAAIATLTAPADH